MSSFMERFWNAILGFTPITDEELSSFCTQKCELCENEVRYQKLRRLQKRNPVNGNNISDNGIESNLNESPIDDTPGQKNDINLANEKVFKSKKNRSLQNRIVLQKSEPKNRICRNPVLPTVQEETDPDNDWRQNSYLWGKDFVRRNDLIIIDHNDQVPLDEVPEPRTSPSDGTEDLVSELGQLELVDVGEENEPVGRTLEVLCEESAGNTSNAQNSKISDNEINSTFLISSGNLSKDGEYPKGNVDFPDTISSVREGTVKKITESRIWSDSKKIESHQVSFVGKSKKPSHKKIGGTNKIFYRKDKSFFKKANKDSRISSKLSYPLISSRKMNGDKLAGSRAKVRTAKLKFKTASVRKNEQTSILVKSVVPALETLPDNQKHEKVLSPKWIPGKTCTK